MITQKQIDTREKFNDYMFFEVLNAMMDDELDMCNHYRREIADADKEAAGMKDEMLDALIEIAKECIDLDCNYQSNIFYDIPKNAIERATGLSIDEVIKAWEERNK